MFKAYKNIWFCGLAASGKTTVLRLLHKHFTDEADFLNDSLEVIEFVNKDIEQNHHTKPTPDSFILTDTEATNYAVQQLIKKADSTEKNTIIELSRGSDTQGVVDFSYNYLFNNLPENLKKNSVFVYVYAPTKDRIERNQQRPALSKDATVFESFFCPQEAFDRFFLSDDFFKAVEDNPVNHLFIPNIYDLEYLQSLVKNLFIK